MEVLSGEHEISEGVDQQILDHYRNARFGPGMALLVPTYWDKVNQVAKRRLRTYHGWQVEQFLGDVVNGTFLSVDNRLKQEYIRSLRGQDEVDLTRVAFSTGLSIDEVTQALKSHAEPIRSLPGTVIQYTGWSVQQAMRRDRVREASSLENVDPDVFMTEAQFAALLENTSDQKALHRCLARLTETSWAVLTGIVLLTRTYQDLAALLDKSVGTIFNINTKAKEQLRKCLERAGVY